MPAVALALSEAAQVSLADAVIGAVVTGLVGGVIGWIVHSRTGSLAAERLRQKYEQERRTELSERTMHLLRLELSRAKANSAHNALLEAGHPEPGPLSLPVDTVLSLTRDLAVNAAATEELTTQLAGYVASASASNELVEIWRAAMTSSDASVIRNLGVHSRNTIIRDAPTICGAIQALLDRLDAGPGRGSDLSQSPDETEAR